jgi:hypothetical protein
MIVTGCCSIHKKTAFNENGKSTTIPVFDINVNDYVSFQKRSHQDEKTAVALAISGGGYRASHFGLGVLLGLEGISDKRNGGNALNEVDYFSTVSGGGFAAASYLLTLKKHMTTGGTKQYRLAEYRGNIEKALRTNLEAYLTIGLFRPKLMFTSLDRGDYLEKAISKEIFHELNPDDLAFRDIFIPAGNPKAPQLPCWICNGTIEINSSRIPFSPKVMENYKIVEYIHREKNIKIGSADDIYKMPYSVFARASASFPGIISECTMTTSYLQNSEKFKQYKYIHISDGGVNDNLGFHTALKMLQTDASRRKVLIIVDAFNDVTQPLADCEKPLITTNLQQTAEAVVRAQHYYMKSIITNECEKNGIACVFLNLLDDAELSDMYKFSGTRLSIDANEQKELVESGKRVAEKNKAAIMNALGW